MDFAYEGQLAHVQKKMKENQFKSNVLSHVVLFSSCNFNLHITIPGKLNKLVLIRKLAGKVRSWMKNASHICSAEKYSFEPLI